MRRLGAVAIVGVSLAGCALLTKDDPVEPKYFTPESGDGTLGPKRAAAGASSAATGLTLHLGRVGAGSYLKERIVHRDSDHELGFYENRRWTERPETYLQRALELTLFEERGVGRALAGAAPTLTADLIDFEEVRGPRPGVRLRVSFALHDDHVVIRERTFTVERWFAEEPPGSSSVDRVASALGDALRGAVDEIADQVLADLAKTRDD